MTDSSRAEFKNILFKLQEGGGFSTKTEFISDDRREIISRATPEVIAGSWTNGFSDPTRHDDNKFRYLVYGIQGQAENVMQMLYLIQAMRRGRAENIGDTIDFLREPDEISSRQVLSTSVIDQDHRSTFGSVGLILEAPAENIIDVGAHDLGTDFTNPGAVAKKQGNICTVDELMDASNPYSLEDWNEVKLVGVTKTGKVKVIGYWIKVDEDGHVIDQETTQHLQKMMARRLDRRPLVRITEKAKKREITDTKVEVLKWPELVDVDGGPEAVAVPWAFAFNRNGLRYFIDFKKNSFLVIINGNQGRPMTLDELHYVVSVLEAELDPEEKMELHDILMSLPKRFKVK